MEHLLKGTRSGKFSIRTQSRIDRTKVISLVKKRLSTAFDSARIGSNKMSVECLGFGQGWEADTEHWNYLAASKAIKSVWGVEPGEKIFHFVKQTADSLILDFTREGGTIPFTSMLEDILGKNILLIPMGRADDGEHSTDEKLDVSNFLNGCKVFASYLEEVGKMRQLSLR
jgi:Cys-Gly metallodipeptidase DUG1